MSDRQLVGLFRAVFSVLWLFGLWWVLGPHPEMVVPFAYLTAYVVAVSYATVIWNRGDPDGSKAILLAVIVPPIAWFLLGLHWLDHHGNDRS